jgi:hypothetical protein
MKVTRRQLRRLILQEMRIKPDALDATNIPPEHLDKIHSLINSGDPDLIDQAQSFIDAYEGDPNYARNYYEYDIVGDLEKLGNKAAEMHQQPPEKPGLKPGYTGQDVYAINDLARSISRKHAGREFPDGGPDAFDAELKHYYDRYIQNVNKSSATYSDRFLEHRILKEMAVRRILEIEMSDQYYLRAPELPGGKVAVGVEVGDLIDALYSFANESYTHIVMSDDLRDFNRDRSQFRYGIYTKIETAIKMLQIHRDPRRLYIQRS